MPTIKTLEEQIFAKEGFRVKLIPLDPKLKTVAAYTFEYMGSNKWRLSDWKRERLAQYFANFRGIEIFRGDGRAVKSDMRLGNLRDSYFDAHYAQDVEAVSSSAQFQVIPINRKRR